MPHGRGNRGHWARLGFDCAPTPRRTRLCLETVGCMPPDPETGPEPNCLQLDPPRRTPPNAIQWLKTPLLPHWPNWPIQSARLPSRPGGAGRVAASAKRAATSCQWGGRAPQPKSTPPPAANHTPRPSPPSPTPSPHGQPHPTQNLHTPSTERLLTRPKRRARRQHVIHQNHPPRQAFRLPHPKRLAKGRLTGRAGGACEGHAVLEPAQELGLNLTAPPRGQPLRQGLRWIEATAHKPSPMQRHRDEHDIPRRGGPPLGHPLAQGAALAREPPVLHAMHHSVRVWSQPKPHPKDCAPHPFPRESLDRLAAGHAGPSPSARWAHPCHLIGHQGFPTTPASPQSPSQIHAPPRCDVCHSMWSVFCVRQTMLRGCRAL